MQSIYSVLKSSLITEKTNRFLPARVYAFSVDRRANKIEIKKAVENIYNVKVEKVNVVLVKGKTKRLRQGQEGKTSLWKKAYVTLKEGQKIEL